MSPPSHQPRVLRVGVLQGGRITDERHLKRPETVTVGRDPRATLVVPGDEAPASFPLFEHGGAGYRLVFTPEMEGRIQLSPQEDLTLSELAAKAARHPQGLSIVLTEKESEEHTSELQSRENLVCRLLLEKKKKK